MSMTPEERKSWDRVEYLDREPLRQSVFPMVGGGDGGPCEKCGRSTATFQRQEESSSYLNVRGCAVCGSFEGKRIFVGEPYGDARKVEVHVFFCVTERE
jgi:hypothetical protein